VGEMCFGFGPTAAQRAEQSVRNSALAKMAKGADDPHERAARVARYLGYGNTIDAKMAKRAAARARPSVDLRGWFARGFSSEPEPVPEIDPRDLEFLNSPVVSPDLRYKLVHAVKTRPQPDSGLRSAWVEQTIPLREAIDDLIERIGPPASALIRILDGGSAAKRAMSRLGVTDLHKFYDYGGDLTKVLAGDDPDAVDSYARAVIECELTPTERSIVRLWRDVRDRVGADKAAVLRAADRSFENFAKGIFRRLPAPMARAVLAYVI
jgi:hypothetical protein